MRRLWECFGRPCRSSLRSAVIPRVAARSVAVAVFSATALGSALLLPAASASPPAGWGPDHLPYRVGVVCADQHGAVALASWPSAATGAPAYALGPVTAGPDGAHTAEPAVDAPGTAAFAGPLRDTVAALLARHAATHDPVVAAEVADAIVAHVAGGDAADSACVAQQGASASAVQALWSDAATLAGPYSVRLQVPAGKLVMGVAAPVSAVVTSASGRPVPGLRVAFDTGESDADLSRDTAVTDARGIASTSLTVSPGSLVRAVHVRVRAESPGTPVTMTAPGRVPLVAPGPTRTVTRTARVVVDTTADPVLRTGVDRALVLPGTVIRPDVVVSGLRGHAGTAVFSVAGPLPIDARRGCGSYATPTGTDSRRSAGSGTAEPAVDIPHDGTFPAAPLALTRPGCYVVSSAIATSDAIPNVRRTGRPVVVAVAPVRVSVAADGDGVEVAGPLAATAAVHGTVPAHLTDVQARLLGPRSSDDGSCQGIHFPAHGATLTVTRTATGVRLGGRSVTATGCYGFRVLGTVTIPGLGSVPLAWTGAVSTTTLVLSPSASVAGLSSSDVVAGSHLTASVTVSGTWTQPGAVRLMLRHLPYDWRGCFGRDWTHAATVGAPGPPVPTNGDGTYRVSTPAVPTDGCWTVVPVLTLSRNRQISLTSTAPIDPMTAFTALRPAPQPVSREVSLRFGADGAEQVAVAGAAMLVLLIAALGSTLSIALRDR